MYDPDLKCPYDPDYEGKDMFLPIQGHVDGLYTCLLYTSPDGELERTRAVADHRRVFVARKHVAHQVRKLNGQELPCLLYTSRCV